jgi:hypothetical protein
MALGLGRHLLFRQLGGGWVAIAAVLAILVLVRFWPLIAERLERWWRSR